MPLACLCVSVRVCVCGAGGVTAGEMAVVRLLAKEATDDDDGGGDGVARRCIIGATKVLSGDRVHTPKHKP